MPKCPSCSFDAPAAAKFCPSCGRPMGGAAPGSGGDDQDMLQTAVSLPPMTPKFAEGNTRPGNPTLPSGPAPTMTHASMPSGSIHDQDTPPIKPTVTQAAPPSISPRDEQMAATIVSPSRGGSRPGNEVPSSSTPMSPASVIPMPMSGDDRPRQPIASAPVRASAGTAIFAGAELGRFVPGTLFGNRYRIIGRLGKGGMGDVYRADDIKLGQPTAMKFLPEQLSQDRAALIRLVNEVKIARAISHPNVCRVFDLGEEGGQNFISMEYVDGEDLASLLRRIGRLPGDKALQIARQLASGLAAAHEKGVLHRDLKPANVMVDGRGHVRIMDFGLAGLAEELKGDTGRAGTPAYMAPEQLAGRGVTAKSDVYAIGLLFYEVFSGKPVFRPESMQDLARLHKQPIPPLSTHVPEIDPAVEKVIMKCLERDPDLRPASALAVTQMLGGDALSAALEAGETPSPELVAASGSRGAIPVPFVAAMLLAVVLTMFGVATMNSKVKLFASTKMEFAPITLADKAREALKQLGHPRRGTDSAFGIEEIRPEAVEGQPTPPPRMRFWYRESDRPIPPGAGGVVSRQNPPVSAVGERTVLMDLRGNVIEVVAPVTGTISTTTLSDSEIGRIVELTDADKTRLKPMDSGDFAPGVFATARQSFESSRQGAQPGASPIRVDVASVGNAVTYLSVRDGRAPSNPAASRTEAGEGNWIVAATLGLITLSLHAVPLWMASWSVRQGKADRRGATRLAVLTFAVSSLAWLARAHYAPDPGALLDTAIPALSFSAYLAAMVWMLYVGLEPIIRKRWPTSLVSWSRLLSGSLIDPMVGREILVGSFLGVAWVLVVQGVASFAARGGTPAALGINELTLMGPLPAISVVLSALISAILLTLAITFVCTLPRFLINNQAFAGAAIFAVLVIFFAMAAMMQSGVAGSPIIVVAALLAGGVAGFVLTRLGLLALSSAFFTAGVLSAFPVSIGGGWTASYSILAMFIVVAVAGLGAFAALGLKQSKAARSIG